jgi:uncharacterized protein
MNPFRYSGPVAAEDVIDREEVLAELLTVAESANNSRLLAPREYGKTSLLNLALREAGKQGWATVYVDFFGVLTLADVAARIETAYRSQLSSDLAGWFELLRRRFTGARIGGGAVPVSLEVDLKGSEQALLERLETPRRLLEARGVRSLIVLDEFQDVLGTHERADHVLRSAIQHHGEAASYVFAGSDLGMMRALFDDRRRAFFRQATRIDLQPLPEADLGEFIEARFRSTGKRIHAQAIGALLDLAAGHPRAAMMLAHELWAATKPRGTASLAVYEDAEREALERASADLRGMWRGLTRVEQETLTTIARGGRPYSRKRGGRSSSGGAVAHALGKLEGAGELLPGADGYRIVDPFLAELLRRDWSAEPAG